MRILHILDHSIPLHSGYTFRTRNILNQQRVRGWETFHVTSPKQGEVEALKEEVDGLTFYRTPPVSGGISNLPIFNQVSIVSALQKRLIEVVQEVKPDVLHAHSPSLNGLAALKVAKQFNLPLVYEVRAFWEDAAVDHGTSSEWGLRYRLTRASETYLLKRASAVTTICEGLRNEMIGRGIESKKITVIPNAVDIDKFVEGSEADADLKTKLGFDGCKVLGFLGSFYAYEGLNLLISALPNMLSQDESIRVLLVGGGPQDENLKRQVQSLGLQDKVVFTGRVPHEQVQTYYDLVDVLVYPRLPMRLTELVTPLKPLEAMAQGKIVVASDVGGHKELIRDRENGYLFKSGDEVSLATTVLDVLDKQAAWTEVRSNGREYVENERNWANSVANYQSVYGSLVG
jgi:PEP-CTERM/exosortase A-associated glycosyltransferase